MEALIIILIVSMLYFIIPSKKELLSDQWDGSDIDGGIYKGITKKPKAVKKKTRKRTKVLPKKVKKKVAKRKVTKRKTKKWLIWWFTYGLSMEL